MSRFPLGLRLVVLALIVYGGTAGGSLGTTDAVVAYDVTVNLVEQGSLAMSGNLLGMEAHRGADGRYYSPFGIAQSVFNIPFYLAGRTAARLAPGLGKPDTLPKAAVAMGSAVAAAGCVGFTYLFLVATLGRSNAGRTTLLLAFGTVLWPYAKFGFNAPLSALFLSAAAFGLVAGTRRGRLAPLAWAGLAAGGALLTRHELALAALPAALFLLLDLERPRRLRGLVAFALPLGACVGAWLLLNAVRFGNPLDSGYLRDPIPGIGSPILEGLHGLLLSPSTSLFLYSPLVLAAVPAFVLLWRRDRNVAIYCLTMVATFVGFYAILGNWAGGRSYGSRYLVPVLPFLVAPLGLVFQGSVSRPLRRAAGTLVALSIVVQLPGVLVDFSKVSQRWAAEHRLTPGQDRRLEWSAAPLWLNTREMVAAVPRNLAYLSGRQAPPAFERATADAGRRDFAQQFWFSLDLWWLYLHYLGAYGAGVVLAFALSLTVVAAWLLVGIARETATAAGTGTAVRA